MRSHLIHLISSNFADPCPKQYLIHFFIKVVFTQIIDPKFPISLMFKKFIYEKLFIIRLKTLTLRLPKSGIEAGPIWSGLIGTGDLILGRSSGRDGAHTRGPILGGLFGPGDTFFIG